MQQALQYQHTFGLTGPRGLVLLAGLFTIFVFGLVSLLAALARAVNGCRTDEALSTERQPERQPDGSVGGFLQALWAVPGKVRIGTVTVHVGWIALSLGISALVVLVR